MLFSVVECSLGQCSNSERTLVSSKASFLQKQLPRSPDLFTIFGAYRTYSSYWQNGWAFSAGREGGQFSQKAKSYGQEVQGDDGRCPSGVWDVST